MCRIKERTVAFYIIPRQVVSLTTAVFLDILPHSNSVIDLFLAGSAGLHRGVLLASPLGLKQANWIRVSDVKTLQSADWLHNIIHKSGIF